MVGCAENLQILPKHDTDRKGIMVETCSAFPEDGNVDYVEFWAGSTSEDRQSLWADGRVLKLGVFRRNVNGSCSFNVVGLKTVKEGIIVRGYNKINVNFAVKKGDMLGFSWPAYGSITYDYLEYDPMFPEINRRYCYGEGTGDSKPAEGGSVELEYIPRPGMTNTNALKFVNSYREYAIRYHWCAEDNCVWVGSDGEEALRSKHDTEHRYLMVSTHKPFSSPGVVDHVKFYAGSVSDRAWSTDRRLKIGIFKREKKTDCDFTLVAFKTINTIGEEGFYEAAVNFQIEGGMFWGFYWDNYGVISYDLLSYDPAHPTKNRNFCGGSVNPVVKQQNGEIINLGYSPFEQMSYRDYAIWFHWCPECDLFERLGTSMGNGPRTKHDTYKRWTEVDLRHPFPGDGYVESVEFWAGSDSYRSWDDNRALTFVIFVNAESDCQFEVQTTRGLGYIGSKGFKRKGVGNIPVKFGQHWGFYWPRYGVVAFDWLPRNLADPSENRFYCGGRTKPATGNVVQYAYGSPSDKDSISHRDYAFWVNFCQECSEMAIGTPFTGPFDKHDTHKRFLIVDQRYPFAAGHINKIELITGSDSDRSWSEDRGLSLVLVTPLGDVSSASAVDFRVDQVIGLGQFPTEDYYLIDNLDIAVAQGQFFGFYWTRYGVVSFIWLQRYESEPSINRYYRGAEVKPMKDDILSLNWSSVGNKDGHSYRDYAIWITYCKDFVSGDNLTAD
jgi:hypothetical protein